jgi:GrpB-like predicted nucleotidyltransferase (UPF0157 family)
MPAQDDPNDSDNGDAADDVTEPPTTPTPPERLPAFTSLTGEQYQAIYLVPPVPLNGPIVLAEYDPAWPDLYAREEARIRGALGARALLLEHAGSTSVPGLAAKPRIDIVLAVVDSADEPAYVPPLEAAGYTLRLREPEWHEHRLLNGPDTDVNLHVFTAGDAEIVRMLGFRDWLRTHPADRDLYERTKRDLAGRVWQYTQHYADAKTAMVEEIIARAQAGS